MSRTIYYIFNNIINIIKLFFLIMKKDKSQHKKVYIGNIYYNATEQEILEILNIVGPIVEFQ